MTRTGRTGERAPGCWELSVYSVTYQVKGASILGYQDLVSSSARNLFILLKCCKVHIYMGIVE